MCTCEKREVKAAVGVAYVVVDLCPACTASNEASRLLFSAAMTDSQAIGDEIQLMARERLKAKGHIFKSTELN